MNLTWQIKPWEHLTTEELYALLALRIGVFVVEQCCPYQEADGKDKKSLHIMASDGTGEIHATARMVRPGVSYAEWSIGRVATSAFVRNSGIGKELMQRTMHYFKTELGNPDIRISAQSYLKNFYELYGFRQVSEEYMEDDIPHIEMFYKG